MSLALRLGRTLHELLQTLTASELKMWIAFDRVSPIGDWRGDVQAAQMVVATLNAQGGKYGIEDVILKFGPKDEAKETSDLEQWLQNL